MRFHELAALAASQESLLSDADFARHDVPSRTVRRWSDEGRLIRAHPRVWRIGGAPATFLSRLRAAVMAAGAEAAASHRSAAALWGLSDPEVVEITVPYERRIPLAGVVVHRSLDLADAKVVSRAGVPVTDPMRTVIDCGAVLPDHEVADLLERALTARLFPIAAIERANAAIAKRGRRGSGVIRRVLDRRALLAEVPESLLEVRMASLMARAGLPPATFQHAVRVAGRRYRLDFAYPDLLIAIEVDGWAKFATPAGAGLVLERQNALVNQGWLVVRFTWSDVVRRPHYVAKSIAAAIDRRRGAQL